MKKFKFALQCLITLPTFVWGALYVGLALGLGLAYRPAVLRPALFVAEWRPWFAKHWEFSTTVGRGIIVHPMIAHGEAPLLVTLMEHERVHVRQAEDLCLMGFVGALLSLLNYTHLTLAVALWMLSPLGLILNYAMAWLRNKDPYLGAEHEIAAYAQQGHRH